MLASVENSRLKNWRLAEVSQVLPAAMHQVELSPPRIVGNGGVGFTRDLRISKIQSAALAFAAPDTVHAMPEADEMALPWTLDNDQPSDEGIRHWVISRCGFASSMGTSGRAEDDRLVIFDRLYSGNFQVVPWQYPGFIRIIHGRSGRRRWRLSRWTADEACGIVVFHDDGGWGLKG